MGGRLRALLLWLLLLAIVGLLIAGIAVQARSGGDNPAATASAASSYGPSSSRGAATVAWIADGDTLDVMVEGGRTRVRLLNVDAPELGHDGSTDQCLAVEARDTLERLAPRGSRVRLLPFGRDRFGRLLAGLYLADGRLANAELVRLGLAAPIVVESNTALLEPVEQARDEADGAGAGLHGAAGCSLPARVRSAATTLHALPHTPSANEVKAALTTARSVRKRLDAVAAELTADQRNAVVQALPDERRQALLIQTRALLAEAALRIAALERRQGQ